MNHKSSIDDLPMMSSISNALILNKVNTNSTLTRNEGDTNSSKRDFNSILNTLVAITPEPGSKPKDMTAASIVRANSSDEASFDEYNTFTYPKKVSVSSTHRIEPSRNFNGGAAQVASLLHLPKKKLLKVKSKKGFIKLLQRNQKHIKDAM